MKQNPVNHPITILGIAEDGSLILSDRGKTITKPGDRVTWDIGSKSGVAEIRAIANLSKPIDVFDPHDPPAPLGHSTSWRGTIREDIDEMTEEEYCIHYLKTDGTFSDHDPKIIVNP